MSKNKIHTVYIDGIPCHWQLMYDYDKKQFVCCLYNDGEQRHSGESRLVAKKYVPHCDVDTNGSEFVNLKKVYGLNEIDMMDIGRLVQTRVDNNRAREMIKQLEKEDGYDRDIGEARRTS